MELPKNDFEREYKVRVHGKIKLKKIKILLKKVLKLMMYIICQ